MKVRPCSRSDCSKKPMFYQSIKQKKSVFLFCVCKIYIKANVAHVFYISLMFSNARHVSSQCTTPLTLVYLLTNGGYVYIFQPWMSFQAKHVDAWDSCNDSINFHLILVIIYITYKNEMDLFCNKFFKEIITMLKC